MLIYNYDKISKEYLYSSEANVDELKTVKTGKICYLIPADATTKAPNSPKEGYVQCFDEKSNSWFFVEDLRGKVVYSKEDLSPLMVSTLGPIPNGYMLDIPKPKNEYQLWQNGKYIYPDINELKESVKQQLDSKYQEKLDKTYPVGPYFVKPNWATIYTNTLVAMKEDLLDNSRLDKVYKILLLNNADGTGFYHMELTNINKFMPFYKQVKEKYKEITEDYHEKIILLNNELDPEVIVSIILNY